MIGTPLGRHAPALDAVRALSTKNGRRDAGRFTVEGPTMLAEAVAAGCELLELYGTPAALGALPARILAATSADRVFAVDERSLARLSDLQTPPGVLAVLAARLDDPDHLLADGRPALVLAGVADPGNAGTLLRSAEIFGIDRAIFTRDAVEPHNPKVVRATMGAFFRMRLAVADAADLVGAARRHGFAIVATAREGTPLPAFRFPERSLVAIGNERHGVAASLPTADFQVAIPQAGAGESLNASVAGGIILYAFSQQFGRTIFEA